MKILIIFISITLIYIIFSVSRFFYWFNKAGSAALFSKPFERNAGLPNILVYGDSTALGVGASSPDKSLIGLLGQYYKTASIKNHASLGLSISKIIHSFDKTAPSDLIVIGCGGVDVLYLKSMQSIRRDIKNLLGIATKNGKRVVIITPLNIGLSKAFPWFLRNFYKARSVKVGKIFQNECSLYKNVSLSNNLSVSAKDVKLILEKMISKDKLHPSDFGYQWAFERARPLFQ